MRALLSLVLIVGFFWPGKVLAEKATKKQLSLGAVLSLTGDAANNGEAIRKGITLAGEELQKQGWSVDINLQDDGTVPTKAASGVQFLLSQNYRIFVGPTWSFLTKAAAPILEKAGAFAVVPAGSSDINGGKSESIFNLCPKRESELKVVTEWIKSRQSRRAYILTPLGDWGVVHREVFKQAAKNAGIEIVGDEDFDYGIAQTALKAIVLKAKGLGADLLLTTAAGGDLANILKFRSQLRWNTSILTTEDLWDGIDAGLVPIDSPMLLDVWVVGLPLNAEFAKRYSERFHEGPRMYADRAYDAVLLLARAAAATDGSPAAIHKYLRSGKPYEGVTGRIEFNESNDRVAENYQVMTALNNKSRS